MAAIDMWVNQGTLYSGWKAILDEDSQGLFMLIHEVEPAPLNLQGVWVRLMSPLIEEIHISH